MDHAASLIENYEQAQGEKNRQLKLLQVHMHTHTHTCVQSYTHSSLSASLTQEEVEAYESLKWELNLLQTNHTSMQYKLACTEEEAKQKYEYTAFKMQIVFEQGSASFPSLSHLKFCILK